MATVESYTKARIDQLIDQTIIDADIVARELIFTKEDGTTINLGVVGGGLEKVVAFPVAPQDGDAIIRTDLNGSPIFTYSTENGWEKIPRLGGVTIPSASVRRVGTQDTVAFTEVVLSFTDEDKDTNNMFVIGSPTRLTIKTPGRYLIRASALFNSTPTGGQMSIKKNGSVYLSVVTIPSAGYREGIAVADLAEGDYIEMFARADNAVAVGYAAGSNHAQIQMEATWLGGPGQSVDDRDVPAVRATVAAGTQVVSSGASAAVALPTENFDTEGMHDPAVNNTRLTIKTSGLYQIDGFAESTTVPVGTPPTVNILKNGALLGPDPYMLGIGSTVGRARVAGQAYLVAGDYLEIQYLNSSNASLTIGRCSLSAVLLDAGNAGLAPAQADVYTVATLPAANTFSNGRIVGVSDGAAGQQARMSMNGAWINLG